MSVFRNSVAAVLALATTTVSANGLDKKGTARNEVETKLIDLEKDPMFTRKGDKLFLNLLNLDQEKVVIRIRDSWGRIVFSEVIKDTVIIEKAFNFEKAYKDDYVVEVVDGKKSFKQVIAIK